MKKMLSLILLFSMITAYGCTRQTKTTDDQAGSSEASGRDTSAGQKISSDKLKNAAASESKTNTDTADRAASSSNAVRNPGTP